MEKITFADVPSFEVDTYTKENLSYPKAEPLEAYKLYTDKKTRLLRSADEIPFVYFVGSTHAYGGAVLSVESVKKEEPLLKFKALMAQYGLKPEDVYVYLGPSLTFSHVVVERSLIEELMAKGYRAAAKRTDGVDFFDFRMMLVVMLRKLGLPFKNIYLDNHDTFECDALLYSELRGDEKKNPTYVSVK